MKELERKRKARRAAGKIPREVYEATSLSQTRPWELEGICRRTWERRGGRAKSREERLKAEPAAAPPAEPASNDDWQATRVARAGWPRRWQGC